VIIPHFNAQHHYIYWSLGGVVGGSGPSFSATGLVTQTLHSWPVKLETVVMLVLPTAFIALGSPVALVVLPSRNNIWHASTYQMSPLVAADNAAMAQVPDGATVQTTLGLLAPLSARTDTFWIGNPGNPATQYIVFDGQQSDYSPVPSDVPAFIKELFPKTTYVQIFLDDQVYVFRRA
jgi:hypothetical protein